MYQENAYIPLLLLLADGRLVPAVVDAPGGQPDLLPTLIDLLGWADVRHASLGRSLRRQVPERVAHFHSPFGLGYVGLREGPWKYWYALRSRVAHLYHLGDDPGERHNLARAHPEVAARLHLKLARMHQLMRTLYQEDRIAPPPP
jgi:arylsulfatase A-like enzyme